MFTGNDMPDLAGLIKSLLVFSAIGSMAILALILAILWWTGTHVRIAF